MKKSFLAVFISATALLMAGCGLDQADQSDSDTSVDTPTEQPKDITTDPPVEKPSDDPVVDDTPADSSSADAKPSVANAVGSSLLNAITGSSAKEEKKEPSDEAPAFQP
jgi:hypothetical protein